MSVDGETRRVMKGVQHGACDYLLKPIRMKELRNIWQHVFRKRMHEARKFFWDEPYLFKICVDRIIRRCIPEVEIMSILQACHLLPVGGIMEGPT